MSDSSSDDANLSRSVGAGSTRDALPLSLRETPSDGLNSSTVASRRATYGYNELKEGKTSPLLRLLSYFWGPIPWMIEIAAIFSRVVRHWEDLGIILTILVVNAVVGF